ncbi:thymocyte nuclear protein 1 [Ambystoma mexicanum]|uniref:thymocyte nuclear protein 1 n=1 Tax=Ambystoma mexicanum TaxID=8296 RepID=UPI0037E7E097
MSSPRRKRSRMEPMDAKKDSAETSQHVKVPVSKKPAKSKVKGPAARRKSSTKGSANEDDYEGAKKVEYSNWLMKSEPESRLENGVDMKFGIEDLKMQPKQTACWDGVRNYQARNFMRDMKVGQEAFFYHSNCKEPGIAGIIKIVKAAYVDHTQFDKKDSHYDPSSQEENPKWSMVDVQFVRMTKRFIPLAELKVYYQEHAATGGPLKNMALFTRSRLSVQPLIKEEFEFILSLEDKDS